MSIDLWLALGSGVGLAAACGLRAFLPLLALGLAGRFHIVPLRPGAEWLTSDPALIALTTATLVEIAGDKIPAVDHALDVAGTVVRPAAAWLAAFAVLAHWPSPWAQLAALALGTAALAVHLGKAKVRLGSTALTLGAANPAVSLFEDAVAFGVVVTALLVPLAALLATVLVLAWVFRGNRSAHRA